MKKFLLLAMLAASAALPAAGISKITKGKKHYVKITDLLLDNGIIKIISKSNIYKVKAIRSNGSKLFVYKREMKKVGHLSDPCLCGWMYVQCRD